MLGFLLGIIFISVLFLILYYLFSYSEKNNFSLNYGLALQKFCQNLGPISYRESVYVPNNLVIYENKLATSLLDISIATTQSNCQNINPLPLPPGFTNQIVLKRLLTTIGRIFWNNNYACISFSGTITLAQWKADFNYKLKPAIRLNNYIEGVECHEGFYNLYLSVRNEIWKWINDHPEINIFFITGHSLGGALSTIASYDMANLNPIHYSFASPRCGNVKFSEQFNNMLPNSMRINNTEDIVPQLPPATWNNYTYMHTNNNIPFTKSLGTLQKDHIQAYIEYLPECFDNRASC